MLTQEGKEGLHFILFFKVAQNKTSKETLGVLLGCSEVYKNTAVAKIKKEINRARETTGGRETIFFS